MLIFHLEFEWHGGCCSKELLVTQDPAKPLTTAPRKQRRGILQVPLLIHIASDGIRLLCSDLVSWVCGILTVLSGCGAETPFPKTCSVSSESFNTPLRVCHWTLGLCTFHCSYPSMKPWILFFLLPKYKTPSTQGWIALAHWGLLSRALSRISSGFIPRVLCS